MVLEDFADDASASTEEVVWSCPVSFAPVPCDDPDLADAVRGEMSSLAAWAELAPAPPPVSGLSQPEIVTLLDMLNSGDDVTDQLNDRPLVEVVRLAADDLRTWYLHATAQQPGTATAAERMTWFWRETALARMLGEMTAQLLHHDEPQVRMLADRAIVPRDHWATLVTESPMPDGDSDG